MICAAVPLIGFCAPSGTGKTTLARYVIGLLRDQGLRIGVIKQARDDFDVDTPGKDSYRLRQAGVSKLLLGSERQSALILEREPDRPCHDDQGQQPNINQLLGLFDQSSLDLILVEGFSDNPFPRIELYRGGEPPRFPDDPWVIAIATDVVNLQADVPVLDINDPWSVAELVRARIGLPPHADDSNPSNDSDEAGSAT